MDGHPEKLAEHMFNLYKVLLPNSENARTQATKPYDKAVKEMSYENKTVFY